MKLTLRGNLHRPSMRAKAEPFIYPYALGGYMSNPFLFILTDTVDRRL